MIYAMKKEVEDHRATKEFYVTKADEPIKRNQQIIQREITVKLSILQDHIFNHL